jgi:uncharacterized protein YjdB
MRWETSNPAVAAVDSTGLVHALGPGTATITATLELADGSAETASTTVTVRSNPRDQPGRGHSVRRR